MLLARPGACGLKLCGSHPHPVCLAVGRPARSRASGQQQQQQHATAKARAAGSCRAHRLVARFKNGGDAKTAEKQSVADTGGGPSDATLVPVTFELSKHCPFGQALAILGDAPALGEWDVTRALRLEWSEGDVWRGRAEVPLDTPVAFKYIQVDDGGELVCWGSDIAGGTNLSLLVSPSDEALSGLALVLEPAEAADTSTTPSLAVHLDSTAVLPESAAAAAGENGQPAAASSATDDDGSSWESHGPAEAEALRAADAFVAADEQQAAEEAEEEAEGDQPQAGLADEPSAEYGTDSDDEPAAARAQEAQLLLLQEEQEQPAELDAAGEEREDAGSAFGSVGQLQLQEGATSTGSEASQGEQQEEQQQEEEQDEEEEGGGVGTAAPGQAEEGGVGQADEVAAAAAAVVAARGPGEEATAESMQDQGLVSDTQGMGGAAGAGAGAGGGGGAGSRALLDPLAAGGVAAGYGDAASVGAAVAAGLMEAGDGETTAGPPAPTLDAGTPPPSWASSSTSSARSHMITSIDLEGGSEADESSSPDTISSSSSSAVDSTPREMDQGQLMAATAQESARLASSTAADAAAGTAASAAADSSSGALEGLPLPSTTPADSSTPAAAAAVADAVLGGAVASVVVPGAAGCQPPPADSKLVAASPSIGSVDADAPLAGGLDKKAITEIEGGSSGVEPIDKYEDGYGALAALAAAAAASYAAGHDHEPATDREGGAAAAEERQLQLVRAEKEEEQEAGGRSGGAGVDGERTGTWTGEAAAAAAAAAATDSGSGGEEGAQRATEETPAAGDSVQQLKKPKNWLQRLFGGGDDSKDDRA